MTEKIDMIGKHFGRLTVIRENGKSKNGSLMYLCECECGNFVTVRGISLRNGDCRSCGCLRKEVSSIGNSTHGHSNERLFNVWRGMIKRCYDVNHPSYHRYGGRGIKVCDKWLNSYEAFRDFMLANGYPENAGPYEYSIDRIDNDGNYDENNCRVVTAKIQSLNKSNNHRISFKGEEMTITEAAQKCGLTNKQVFNRLDKGWDLKRALTQPLTQTFTYSASGQKHTIAEWAEIMGVTDAVIRGRLKTHTMQQIYDEYVGNNNKIEVNDFSVKYETANGITMNRREWSKKLGINETTLRKLLKEQTMQELYDDWKKSNGRPSSLRRGALEVNGIKKSQKEWCEELNISPKCMRKYLSKYTMQEIYDDVVNNLGRIRKGANPPKLHEANGELHSQADWARILGVPASSLGLQLKKHTMQEIYDSYKNRLIQE